MKAGRWALAVTSAPLVLLFVLVVTPIGDATVVSLRLHIAFITAAVVVAGILAFLSLQAFLTGGRISDLALGCAFLAFAAIYAWHGVFTGHEPAFKWLIYGPPSRIAFAFWLLGVPATRRLRVSLRLPLVIGAILGAMALAYACWALSDQLAAWIITQPTSRLVGLRVALESAALLLAAMATWQLLGVLQRGLPVVVVVGAILVVEQSLFFLVASAWDILWWAAHMTGAIGTTALAVGVLVVVKRVQEEAKLGLLQRDAEVRKQFLNNASHALRTPLTPLSLQLHLLSRQVKGTPSEAIVGKAQHSVERLKHIVDEMLLAAAARPPQDPRAPALNLARIARELVSDLEPKANAKGLQMLLDDKACFVAADEDSIRKVMLHLLENAMAYTDQGYIHVTTRRTRTGAAFTITDTGQGIAPQDLPLMFTPFAKLGKPEQQRTAGDGLSLAVCRAIIASHGGTIEAESPGLGKGTRIRFSLPRGSSPRLWS